MRIRRLVGLVFTGVGAVFLLVAGVAYQRDAAFAAKARSATGHVVELIPSWSQTSKRRSPMYASRVRFVSDTGQSQEFVERISSDPPSHRVGEEVRVLYDPQRPYEAVLDDFWGRFGWAAISAGVGAGLSLLGAAFLVPAIRSARLKTRLRQEGRPIQADFLHVFADTSISFNGKRPFKVAVQGDDPTTGALRRFDSLSIWVDPTARLQGRKVPVLLDPTGQAYLVDLRGIVDESAYA